MANIKIRLTAATDVGLVRKNNEDNFIVCGDLSKGDWTIPPKGTEFELGEYGTLLVVADGMGGTNAGEVASAIAIATIQDLFKPETLKDVIGNDSSIQKFLIETVKTADLMILNHSKEDDETKGMGTTVVMAWILGSTAYVCWCGDSRCYLLNPNIGYSRLSKDHSYVQDLVDKGELTQENAFDHPYSNIITRCLGDQQTRAIPDTAICQLKDGDILMLCSDGLCGLCRDEEIMDVVSQNCDDVDLCTASLIQAALNNGGYDNVTVAICSINKEETAEECVAKNDLQSTIKGYPKTRNFFFSVLIIITLLVIAASVFFYFNPEQYAAFIQQITDIYNNLWK